MTTREVSRSTVIAITAGVLGLVLAATPGRAQDCVGDCNGSGTVTIEELILGVAIAQGFQPLSACPSFDCEGTGTVPINCLIQAVNNALVGCGGDQCALAAGVYTITQLSGGLLSVASVTPFPFPAGGTILQSVSAATEPDCIHDVVVPFPGGIDIPRFCVPGLGFTVELSQIGCGIGEIDSNGGSDYTVMEVGDTSSQPECDNQQECFDGEDSKVRVDVTVGNGTTDTCSGGEANLITSIPVNILSWLNAEECPSSEPYNPDTDLLVLDANQVLDLTTDTNTSVWMDLSGDGCAIAGRGPAAGLSDSGVCLDVAAQTVDLAAAGTIGSRSNPLYDISFSASLPNSFTGPQPPSGATCESPPLVDYDGTVIRCLE